MPAAGRPAMAPRGKSGYGDEPEWSHRDNISYSQDKGGGAYGHGNDDYQDHHSVVSDDYYGGKRNKSASVRALAGEIQTLEEACKIAEERNAWLMEKMMKLKAGLADKAMASNDKTRKMRFFGDWKSAMHDMRLEGQIDKTTKTLEDMQRVATELGKALSEEQEAIKAAELFGETGKDQLEQVLQENQDIQLKIEMQADRMQACQRRLEAAEQQIIRSRSDAQEVIKEVDAYEKRRKQADAQGARMPRRDFDLSQVSFLNQGPQAATSPGPVMVSPGYPVRTGSPMPVPHAGMTPPHPGTMHAGLSPPHPGSASRVMSPPHPGMRPASFSPPHPVPQDRLASWRHGPDAGAPTVTVHHHPLGSPMANSVAKGELRQAGSPMQQMHPGSPGPSAGGVVPGRGPINIPVSTVPPAMRSEPVTQVARSEPATRFEPPPEGYRQPAPPAPPGWMQSGGPPGPAPMPGVGSPQPMPGPCARTYTQPAQPAQPAQLGLPSPAMHQRVNPDGTVVEPWWCVRKTGPDGQAVVTPQESVGGGGHGGGMVHSPGHWQPAPASPVTLTSN